MKNVKKTGLIIGYLFLAYNIIGFLILPPVARYILEKQLSNELGRSTSIGILTFNPYSLSTTIQDFHIKEQDKTSDFIAFNTLYLNVQISSVLKLAPIIKELRIEKPFIKTIRHKDESYNFSDIINRFNQKSPEPDVYDDNESSPNIIKFTVRNINILDGSANIIDQFMGKTHRLKDLNISIPSLSNLEDINSVVDLQCLATFNNSPVAIKCKSRPFSESMQSFIDMKVNGIDVPYYFDYLPADLDMHIVKGVMDIYTNISFALSKRNGPDIIVSSDLSLRELYVTDTNQSPFLKMASCQINIAPSRITKGSLVLSYLELHSPKISIKRDNSGKTNISSLFLAQEDASVTNMKGQPGQFTFNNLVVDEVHIKDSNIFLADHYKSQDNKSKQNDELLKLATFDVTGVSVDMAKKMIHVSTIDLQEGNIAIRKLTNGDLNVQVLTSLSTSNEQKQEHVIDETPWNASINKLTVNNFNIDGHNLAPESDDKITIDKINLNVENFSTRENEKGKIDFFCKLNKSADITLSGQCSINPIVADTKMSINGLNLAWIQPFVLNDSGITISNGIFSSNGDIYAALNNDMSKLEGTYKGAASIEEFRCIDETEGLDLASWKKFGINGIDVSVSPLYASISDITFDKMYSNAVINQDGTINFLNIVNRLSDKFGISQTDSKADTDNTQKNMNEEEVNQFAINIGKMTLKNSSAKFIDRSIEPKYSTIIDDIDFTISNLSTDGAKVADLIFDAKIEGYSAINITGITNPFKEDLLVDVNIQLDNMDMSPLSPYTGKYIGYDIEKGELSVDLDYNIKGSLLDSLNDLLIDGFTFGKKVESEEAINAPLKLGVSLLKDRKGKIKLNAPVKGRIDDPEFEFGKIILKTILNVVVKAATTPFSFIASIFGGDGGYSGDNINHIEFDHGDITLTNLARRKLETIEKALYERPGLEFKITGFADIEKDRRKMISKRLNEFIKTGKSNFPLSSTDQESSVYDRYINMAYKLSETGDYKYLDDLYKEHPLTNKDRMILKYIAVTDDDLKTIATDRAKVVRNCILRQARIENERIQLKESKTIMPDKIEKLESSRVVLEINQE